MGSARVEFLGRPSDAIGSNNQELGMPVAAAQTPTTSTDALTGEDRVTVPAGAHRARITAIGVVQVVAWGADPTATLANGLRIASGVTEIINVKAGDKLSLIEGT